MMDSFDDFIRQDLDILEDLSHSRAVKVYKERKNPFEYYSDVDFVDLYRFDKQTAKLIVDVVREDCIHESNRGRPISPEIQVMATIRYIAKGSYQKDIADVHGISQTSMSEIIRKVVTALARRMGDFIKFPQNDRDLQTLKTGFYQIAGFPQCVGVIDCTHIKIKNPGGELGGRHRCRKGFYSLNVQIICDSNYMILDIVARWRGSAHDSRIWQESAIKRKLERSDLKGGVLLGDNGYACSKIMLTPFRQSANLRPAARRYNRSHILTRNTVEKLFGQIKNKFRCCFNGIMVDLNTAKNMIVAIAVLFNISRIHNTPFATDDFDANEDEEDDDDDNEDLTNAGTSGSFFREQFINRHFV